MLVSILGDFFFIIINVNTFVVFIKIHFGSTTSFEIKTLLGRWLWTLQIHLGLRVSLSKPLLKSCRFCLKSSLLLLLKIIDHILQCKLGACEAHALHSGIFVVLVLCVLEVHQRGKVLATRLSRVVRVLQFEFVLVLF